MALRGVGGDLSITSLSTLVSEPAFCMKNALGISIMLNLLWRCPLSILTSFGYFMFFNKQVDDDFIAAYQASYGVTQELAGTNVATATGTSAAAAGSFIVQVGWVYVCNY